MTTPDHDMRPCRHLAALCPPPGCCTECLARLEWDGAGGYRHAASRQSFRDCPTCDDGGPGSWGWVTVAVRPDGTHELRPAFLQPADPDDGLSTVAYSPDCLTGFRDAPPAIAATWRFWHAKDRWRRWEDLPHSVVVDSPTWDARKVRTMRPEGEWPGLDTATSVSSQHYIDTGHYLPALPVCPECLSLDTMPDGPPGWLVCEQCCTRFDPREVTA